MKAVFFDRDGTLIVEPPGGDIVSVDEPELFPDTLEALGLLAKAGYAAIVISNQPAINAGMITEAEFNRINEELEAVFEQSGVAIAKTYMCPHLKTDNCACIKPKPTMILQGAKEFGVELAESYMVGDRLTDVEAGKRAGTKTILVKTGVKQVVAEDATYTADSLLNAVKFIISN